MFKTKESVGRTPTQTNAPRKTEACKDSTILLKRLQQLRDMALQHAVDYRFDPVAGQIHDEYYYMLSTLLRGL